MAIFTIGDLHLSLGGNHSMEVFSGWEGYVERIERHWCEQVCETDTVVLAGDSSWGMTLEQALPDFAFLQRLPGRKLMLKGNHDYWWSTRRKMEDFFAKNGLTSLEILHNNSVAVDEIAICGSRGWLFETGEAFDDKIISREAMRLELSLTQGVKTGLTPVVFLHYPPVYGDHISPQILETLHRFGVQDCYYGHIHASGCRWAINGTYAEVRYHLISGDYLQFTPMQVFPQNQ